MINTNLNGVPHSGTNPVQESFASKSTSEKSSYNTTIANEEDKTSKPSEKLVLDKNKKSTTRVSRKELDAVQLYLKEIEFSPLLTPEEEVKYGRLARQGDELGRTKMITCNLRLVVKISRRYMNRGLPLPDLIEEGNLGLIHAV